MYKKIIVLLLLIFFSCQEKKNQQINSVSKNQAQLKKWYNKSASLIYSDYFKMIDYADSIQKNATNESNDYKSLAYITYGIYYSRISEVNKAFNNYNKAFELLKESKNDTLLYVLNIGIGNYHKNTGDYNNSLKYLIKGLFIAEHLNDSLKIGKAYSFLGQLYLEKEDVKQAKDYLNKAVAIFKNNKNNPSYLISIHTLANIYGMNGDFSKALDLDNEGLKICDNIDSNDLRATFIDNKANCYMYSNRLDSAKYYFNECLRIDLLNKNGRQISDSYSNLAQLAIFEKDASDVLSYANKSIEIAEKANYKPGIVKNYQLLIDFYKSQNNFVKALEMADKYQEVNENLINDKKETAVAEFKTIYESEKKEKELLQSKIAINNKENLIKRKNAQFQILAIISLALITIGYLFYRQQRLKNKQQEQEFQLKSAIKEIESQNQLQEQRLSISRDLHDNIGAQLTFVISSVDTIKFGNKITDERINNQLTKISDFTKSTIIELRDTIWAMNKDEFSFEDLRSRIFNFIEKAKIAKEDIGFEFKIDEKLAEIQLSSIVGINIYRTIQESINNAIKYSNGTKISVDVKSFKNKIQIEVKDNGQGFDIENTDFGNGLNNMKKRIEEIDGKVQIDSRISYGTVITILI
jgi:signal transduction histidine kinase